MQLCSKGEVYRSIAESPGSWVLSIDPGSDATRVGLFEGERAVLKETLSHGAEELARSSTCFEQLEFRKEAVLSFLSGNGVDLERLTAVISRGGVLKHLGAGTYRVNDKMAADLGRPREDHLSNLGGIIAYEIAKAAGVPAYIADPVSVDGLADILPFSGLWESERRTVDCGLHLRTTAFRYARDRGMKLTDINLSVAHLGRDISVVPFRKGDMGSCGTRQGIFFSCFGTSDLQEVKCSIALGDEEARLVFAAICRRIAGEIGTLASVLKGDVHAIVLTGGLACDEELFTELIDRVGWIAPIVSCPGEEDLEALNNAVLRLISGEETEKEYR
jgi:butyrate kinase